MVPTTTSAIAVFVLLVSPGLVFELLWQRSRPRRDESTFVEVSRVLLAGVVFSGSATLVIMILDVLISGTAPELPVLVGEGSDYVAQHPGLSLGTLITVVTAAVCLSIAAHDLLTPRNARRIVQETVWHTAFSRLAGPGSRVFLSVQLKDGSTITGYSAGYSTEPDPAMRDLLLTAPLAIRLSGQKDATPLDSAWQSMVLSGAEICNIAASYIAPTRPVPARVRRLSLLAWAADHAWQLAVAAEGVILVVHVTLGLTGR
jgi:hypothetical protein